VATLARAIALKAAFITGEEERVMCMYRTQPILRHIRVATAFVMVATLFSTASFAVSPEQRSAVMSACNYDAMRFCMGSLGNEQRLIACMARNQSKLSARCKAAIPRG
jgi:hypothetical protein